MRLGFRIRPSRQLKSGRNPAQGFLALLMLLGVGAFAWFMGAQPLRARALELGRCGEVAGVVLEAGPDAVRAEEVRVSGKHGSRMVTKYVPEVKFRYTVDGREYTSTNFTLGPWHTNQEDAAAISSSYSVGDSAWVSYPSDAPGQGFLVRTYSGPQHIVLMMFGAAIMICGSLALTTLIPVGSIEEPDPRVTLATSGLGLVVTASIAAHYFTAHEATREGWILAFMVFLVGLPLLGLLWGVKTLVFDR